MSKSVKIKGKEIKKKNKKKQKNSITEKAFKANPLARLGFGITAYVDILWSMVFFFTLATVLVWPTMTFFEEGTGYSNPVGYENTMLANIGYSSVQCASIPVNIGKLAMTCPYGTIGLDDGKPLDFGVNYDPNTPRSCKTNDGNEKCKPDNPALV